MKLYLMRHGQAANTAPSDHQRPLTAKGIAQAKNVAQILAHLDVQPAYIFASPRVRAQQTAAHLSETLGVDVTTEDACNFDFTVKKALDLAARGNDADVICVGHNPSMSEICSQLTGTYLSLQTATVVCISLLAFRQDAATLSWVLPPQLAAAITKG